MVYNMICYIFQDKSFVNIYHYSINLTLLTFLFVASALLVIFLRAGEFCKRGERFCLIIGERAIGDLTIRAPGTTKTFAISHHMINK